MSGAGSVVLGDARFFNRAGPFTLAEIAEKIGATIAGPAAAQPFAGVAPLQSAGPDQVSFLHNPKYISELATTRAGAVIVAADLAARVQGTALVVGDPHLAWAQLGQMFHPLPPLCPGVHPSAVIDPSAIIDPSAEIGPLAVIGARAEIGPRCRIAPHVTIGDGVVLGEDCRIGANASVSHAILGKRVYLYPGARIGQDGFGFAITRTGFLTVPQLGRVILEDDVEIGANACVDRGGAHDTVIGQGTRLDNLVQIGHNVRVGRYCAMAAQAGIAGSTVVGDFVQFGGQAGTNGHISIGDRARIGAQAGVVGNVEPGSEILGSPALPKRLALISFALLRRMAETRGAGRPASDAKGRGGASP